MTKKIFLIFFIISAFFFLSFNVMAKKRTAAAKPSSPIPEPPISQSVIDALAKGNVSEAAVELGNQPTSAKSLYLLNATTRAVLAETSKKKPVRTDAHQYYQNLGIAYHNLYLFLKTKNIEQAEFTKMALKAYKKSRGPATPVHKLETDILIAALLAAGGEEEKANELIEKTDLSQTSLVFPMQEYLATYHAAKGDVDESISFLKAAYKERPDTVLTWLAIGDDFYKIKDDARFIALLNEWQIAKSAKKLELSLPKSPPPKLEFMEPPIKFKHPVVKVKKVKKHRSVKKKKR